MHWSGGHSSVHVCTLGAPLGLRGTTVGARFSLSRVPRRVTHCLACNSAKAMDASMFRVHSYSRPPHYLLHTPSHTPSYSLYRTLLTTWKQLTRGAVGLKGISLPLYFKRARWTSRQSSRPPVCTVHCAQCCAALPHQDRIIKPFLSQTSGCQQPLRACANANATTARLALDSLGLGLTWKGRLKEPQLGPLDTPAWLS